MKVLFVALLLPGLLAAEPPLQVARVVRLGVPPFEDNGRLYRLEGEGCLSLRVNERLTLQRSGERRYLGRLQVMEVKDGYALARLAEGGETYPLRGDHVVRHEMALGLPAFPSASVTELATLASLAPKAPHLPIPHGLAQGVRHREPIFFVKGQAELSPAAQEKLKAWAASWGLDGHWVLLIPEGSESGRPVVKAQVEILQAALRKLGVKEVDVQTSPEVTPGRYDSIHVAQDPW